MAEQTQERYVLRRSLLKPKYQSHDDNPKIRAYCRDIQQHTNATCRVGPPNGAFLVFDVAGQSGAVRRAVQYIQGEFVIRQKPLEVDQDQIPEGILLPRLDRLAISGPRKSYKPLRETQQQDLIAADPDTPQLLTREALRRHDVLTGTTQLRQFACGPCDNVWWRIVSNGKAVSRCRHCRKRYDVLPFDRQFGIGRFICQNCGNTFYSRCTATSTCPCYTCDNREVTKPYIHPSNRLGIVPNRTRRTHYCDECHGMGHCPNYRRVINSSTEHDSTGSTQSTCLSQPDFGDDAAPYFDFSGNLDGSVDSD